MVVTPEILTAIMPYSGIYRAQIYAPLLTAECKRWQIDSAQRMAHFLAQIAHESGSLRYTEEIASGRAYEGRKDLGNTQKGDGARFKGRGLIQLTGRANYEEYSRVSGVDYIAHPEWLARPADAVAVSAWFWFDRELNELADRDELMAITRSINGGYNGLSEREAFAVRAKKILIK